MRVSLNWLKDYIDVDASVDQLARQLTMLGLEIEAIERSGEGIGDVYVGKILSIEPHPDAEKLVVCKTDIGKGKPLQIVCGAQNMKEGDKVPTAIVGATLTDGFKITGRTLRGVASQGMMCSARELGLGEDHSGLLILDDSAEIGADAIPLLGLDDVVLDIEITPNRGDWASMIGVARELAALYGRSIRIPEIVIQETGPDASELSSVTIENDELCPRYIGRVLTDVKIALSPQWLATRLIAAGQRPINNVVDITNYVLMETGHPLHAFDYDLLKENRIVVRNARAGETITTIDEEVRELKPEMLIIADAETPVAVAGVMGGHTSEVSEKTTRVFLESAYFNPVSIRRTSRALGLQSEASAHFQRGADPEMALYAIDRVAMLMQELAGAKVLEGRLDEYPKPLAQNGITLRYQRSDLLLGTAVAPDTQRGILERLGFRVLEEAGGHLTVRTPTWRHDCAHEADLIEEVARLNGYDKIPVQAPHVRRNERVFAPEDEAIRALRGFLVGQGLTEFFSWPFSCQEDAAKCGLDGEYLDMVALENPLSENHATMRSSLIPGLIASVSYNVRHGVKNIMAFELGAAYKPVPGKELPEQAARVGVVLSGTDGEKHWSGDLRPLDFYDLKGYCEAVLDYFGVAHAFGEAEFGTLRSGQCAKVEADGHVLGYIGQVRESILKAYDIEQPAYLFELDVHRLLGPMRETPQFEPIPTFPPSLRDMALVVDASVLAGDLRDTALQFGGKLLRSVEIFDVYAGKQVPEGKKSVALSLVFQSAERTLTDKNTQKAWDKIYQRLHKTFGAELR